MKEKRTFIACARLLPYRRQCNGCRYAKSCSLYWRNDFAIERNRIKNSLILNTGEEEFYDET